MEILRSYFDALADAIRQSSWVVQEQLSYRQIDEDSAYIKGELYLHGGYVLHVAEFVVLAGDESTIEKYRYHLQDARQRPIARWDNAPHFPDLKGFPNHRHGPDDQVGPSEPMTIPLVLDTLETVLKDV